MNAWAGISQRTKEFQQENADLKEALREAIFSRSIVRRRCVEVDPAGNTYELDWSDEAKRWAALCGVDLEKMDPSLYCRW